MNSSRFSSSIVIKSHFVIKKETFKDLGQKRIFSRSLNYSRGINKSSTIVSQFLINFIYLTFDRINDKKNS